MTMKYNITTNNNLPIYIEFGNIFYQNFNTNETFYKFLLDQQDETKTIVPTRISDHNSSKDILNIFYLHF